MAASHWIEIEIGRYAHKFIEGRICQLCHQGVEWEAFYACQGAVFNEIRGRYCYFKQALAHNAR